MSAEHVSDREGKATRALHGGSRPSRLGRVTRAGLILVALGAVGSLTVQCSASNGNPSGGFNTGGSGNGSNSDASATGGSAGQPMIQIDSGSPEYSRDAFFAEDPPPKNCGDGGGIPPTPGGTPQCPDDKNLQGCPCATVGETAACWPGYRRNRNHGDCRDGQTTCVRSGENQLVWGPCQNYTGISSTTFEPLGTTGTAACTCFSHGQWNLQNTEPCFITDTSTNTVLGAVSTYVSGGSAEAGTLQLTCPSIATQPNYWNNPTPPSQPWSGNTVSADCTGYFKLCYTIKALSAVGAQPSSGTDCVVKQVCTEGHYDVANQTQAFPDLPGWTTDTAQEQACARKFDTNGGYAEMSVDGQSDECDQIKKIFLTVPYCPNKCSDPANTNDPDCKNCTYEGSGQF